MVGSADTLEPLNNILKTTAILGNRLCFCKMMSYLMWMLMVLACECPHFWIYSFTG